MEAFMNILNGPATGWLLIAVFLGIYVEIRALRKMVAAQGEWMNSFEDKFDDVFDQFNLDDL